MLKKNAWIAALVVALSMVFINCPVDGGLIPDDRGQTGEREWVTVWQFSVDEGIQALPVGPLTFGAGDAGNPIKPLVRAAEDVHASYEIIKVDGKNALKYVTHANWGPGFDLPNKVFGFYEGDKITVKGKAEGAPIDLALNKNQGGAQQIVGERITAEGDFTVEAELTAGDVASIVGNEQGMLRFEDRTGETTVTITEIIIEGKRIANIQPLSAPSITLSGDTLSWTAVTGAGGYALYAGGDSPVLTLKADDTSVNLRVALNGQAAGAKTITLVAVGVPGSSGNSPKSNEVSYTFAPIALPIKITVDGDDDVDAFVKLFGGTAEFELIAPTAPATDSTGYKVTKGHNFGDSFPYIEVDLGTTTKLSDIASITFTAKQVSGDVGYKRFHVAVADAASLSFKQVTRKSINTDSWWTGAPATPDVGVSRTATMPVFEALVKDSGIKDTAAAAKTVLAICINTNVPAGASYEITDIEITIGSNTADEELSGALLDVTVIAPVTNVAPQTTITKTDSDNAVYTGTVRWSPYVSGGKFDVFQAYTATVVLIPAKTYKMPTTDTGFKVNTASPDTGTFAYDFNQVKFDYTFPATYVLGEPNVLFDLSKVELTAGAYTGTSPFISLNTENATGTWTVVTEGGKTFIRIAGKNNNGTGIVINTGASVSSSFKGLRVKITVTGKAPANQQVRFQQVGGSYGFITPDSPSDSAADGTFTMTKTFTWAEVLAIPSYRAIVNNSSGDIDYYTVVVEAIPY